VKKFGISIQHVASLVLILASLAAANCGINALAQGVLAQSDDRYTCESIVLARYLDCERSHSQTADSLKAYYSVSQILKGPPCSGRLTIKFDIDHRLEKSTVSETKNKVLFPIPKNVWLGFIFISYSVPKNGSFETFDGSKGRIEYSEKVLAQVIDDLKKRGEFHKSEL
jgi:hypothetical protein